MRIREITVLLLVLSCRPPQPKLRHYIGKYKACPPQEYMQKFPGLADESGLDTFSRSYYNLYEDKIKGSTLLISDSTFVIACDMLRDTTGHLGKLHFIDEFGSSLDLEFSSVKGAGNVSYEPEGYRILHIPLVALKDPIPYENLDPISLRLVYKKISADTLN